jgi:hypothetical protein
MLPARRGFHLISKARNPRPSFTMELRGQLVRRAPQDDSERSRPNLGFSAAKHSRSAAERSGVRCNRSLGFVLSFMNDFKKLFDDFWV